MYSGFAVTKYSGRLIGAHQHIDRIARRQLKELLPDNAKFPGIRSILRFEGKGGPDGIKLKSPAHNEPWHYLDPLGGENTEFLKIIDTHYLELVENLRKNNQERAAFEAAWLAHAVVDGLTPAHHYPYEETIEVLREGRGKESRTTYKEKLLFTGDTIGKTIGNTYKVYGPKGLFTSHHTFEFGVMLLLRPLRLPDAKPSQKDIDELEQKGRLEFFMHRAREVAVMDLYETYLSDGWTPKLSNKIRHGLAPTMVRTVTVMWFSAAREAGL